MEIEYTLDGGDEWIEWDFSDKYNIPEVIVPYERPMVMRGNCPHGTSRQDIQAFYSFFIYGDITVEVLGCPYSLLGKSRRNTTTLLANGENENVYHDISFFGLFNNNETISNGSISLPAKTLSKKCYGQMFGSCKNMSGAMERLPAMNLAEQCYSYMFSNTALSDSPEIMAEKSEILAYWAMFKGCNSLNTVWMHIVEGNPYTSGDNLCQDMLSNCSSEGTLYVPESDIADYFTQTVCPTGWTVSFSDRTTA